MFISFIFYGFNVEFKQTHKQGTIQSNSVRMTNVMKINTNIKFVS